MPGTFPFAVILTRSDSLMHITGLSVALFLTYFILSGSWSVAVDVDVDSAGSVDGSGCCSAGAPLEPGCGFIVGGDGDGVAARGTDLCPVLLLLLDAVVAAVVLVDRGVLVLPPIGEPERLFGPFFGTVLVLVVWCTLLRSGLSFYRVDLRKLA